MTGLRLCRAWECDRPVTATGLCMPGTSRGLGCLTMPWVSESCLAWVPVPGVGVPGADLVVLEVPALDQLVVTGREHVRVPGAHRQAWARTGEEEGRGRDTHREGCREKHRKFTESERRGAYPWQEGPRRGSGDTISGTTVGKKAVRPSLAWLLGTGDPPLTCSMWPVSVSLSFPVAVSQICQAQDNRKRKARER